MEDGDDLLATGDVADLIGIQTWRLQHLFKRGMIPEPRRLGRFRVFRAADVPAIKRAAIAAGYLSASRELVPA